jgi:hypothetical protein
MFDEQGDQPAKVTWAHLARAERICPRRLAKEHANTKGNRAGASRWRISNQVTADVRLAHTDLATPRADRFVATPDLSPEQRHVYDLAARWYVTLFGERPVRVIDEDPWGTDLPGDVRLVGPAGIAFTDAVEHPEIRLLAFGARTGPPPLLIESPAVRFALLRRPDWLGASVRVCVADLVHGSLAEDVIDVGDARPELDEWLAARLEVIRARVEHPVPKPGLECGWCPFVIGCEPHQ